MGSELRESDLAQIKHRLVCLWLQTPFSAHGWTELDPGPLLDELENVDRIRALHISTSYSTLNSLIRTRKSIDEELPSAIQQGLTHEEIAHVTNVRTTISTQIDELLGVLETPKHILDRLLQHYNKRFASRKRNYDEIGFSQYDEVEEEEIIAAIPATKKPKTTALMILENHKYDPQDSSYSKRTFDAFETLPEFDNLEAGFSDQSIIGRHMDIETLHHRALLGMYIFHLIQVEHTKDHKFNREIFYKNLKTTAESRGGRGYSRTIYKRCVDLYVLASGFPQILDMKITPTKLGEHLPVLLKHYQAHPSDFQEWCYVEPVAAPSNSYGSEMQIDSQRQLVPAGEMTQEAFNSTFPLQEDDPFQAPEWDQTFNPYGSQIMISSPME